MIWSIPRKSALPHILNLGLKLWATFLMKVWNLDLTFMYPNELNESQLKYMDFIQKYYSKDITIQWSMGNSCNFECEYCPTQLHDGSLGWYETSKYVDIIEKICKHYQEQDKVVNFEFIGGEVTVIPALLRY